MRNLSFYILSISGLSLSVQSKEKSDKVKVEFASPSLPASSALSLGFFLPEGEHLVELALKNPRNEEDEKELTRLLRDRWVQRRMKQFFLIAASEGVARKEKAALIKSLELEIAKNKAHESREYFLPFLTELVSTLPIYAIDTKEEQVLRNQELKELTRLVRLIDNQGWSHLTRKQAGRYRQQYFEELSSF